MLTMMIDADAHRRQGKAVTNFDQLLPSPQSDLAQQTLKDPYIFDFLTLEVPFHERELETELIRHLEKFLLELGQGFAFVGRQYPLAVADEDFSWPVPVLRTFAARIRMCNRTMPPASG